MQEQLDNNTAKVQKVENDSKNIGNLQGSLRSIEQTLQSQFEEQAAKME